MARPSKFTFRRAKPQHVDALIARLRPEDRREAEAAGCADVAAKLHAQIALPGDCRAILDETGRCLALLGAQETEYGASPWMLCADDIARAGRFTRKYVPRWVAAWGRKWGYLANAVDARNTMHQRFIERCGFRWIGETRINGFAFRMFDYVHRRRDLRHLRRECGEDASEGGHAGRENYG